MNNVFENIKHIDETGQEYWSARELAAVIGYADYRNFNKIIDKAICLCKQNGMSVGDHFVEANEMVTIGSGAQRKQKSYHLSRYACLLVSMSLSSKKEMALPALEYFSGKQNVMLDSSQSVDAYTNTDIVFFSDPEGKLRVELVFDGDTVWTTQKRITEIFQVDVRTVSYHINEILESGELNKYSVVQKSWITSADATKAHMGLTSWAQAPNGKVLKSDVTIAKNYLLQDQMKELNEIVSAYIDLAANRARRHIPTTMEQWAEFLDSFLTLSSYPILMDKGKVSALEARIKAYEEYDKFRVIQDREFLSDFDKEVLRLKDELGLFD